MEEQAQGYSVQVRISGTPQGDLSKSLSHFFTNRRKSGGGDNQVTPLSSTLYKICFKDKKDQERVLSKEHHEIKVSSTQEPLAVQVTCLEPNEDSSGATLDPDGATLVSSPCDTLDCTAVPVSSEAEEEPESPRTKDSPPVRSESLVPNPHVFSLIEKRLQEELSYLNPAVAWSVDSSHTRLTFEGTLAVVLQAKTIFKELLGMVVERPVELSGYELAFLRTLGKINFLEKKLHYIGLKVVLQIAKNSATLLGLNTESVKLANDVLDDLLDHKILEGIKDWEEQSEAEGGQKFMKSLLQRFNHPLKQVDIRVTPIGTLVNILVVGCTECVMTVIGELKSFLGRNGKSVDPTLASVVLPCDQEEERLEISHLSLAKSFNKFLTLVGLEDSLKGKVTWSLAPPPSCVIILRGAKQDVKRAREEVTKKLQALSSTELVLEKPGALQYFCSKGKDYLALLLKTHKCLVVLRDSKTDFRNRIEEFWFPGFQQTPATPGGKTPDCSAPPSTGLKFHSFQQLGHTACVHVKNVVIQSKLGKIEAEEADAILNLLSSGYDIIDTPVFHAAGDSVQKEFRNKGNSDGCTYTGAGRLRCKIIIHVRLDWRLSHQYTLKNILEKCDSQREYRSVCLFLTDTENVPPLEAAGILVNTVAVTAAQMLHLTLIKIVTSEERFSAALKSKLESCNGQLVPEEPRRSSFFQAFFRIWASDSSNKNSLATEDTWQCLKTKSSSMAAVLQLFAEKQETLTKVIKMIRAHFSSLYSQYVLRDPALERLTDGHKEEVYFAVLRTGVMVSKAKDCLKLEGTDPEVEEVKTLVEKVLRELKTTKEREEDKWLLTTGHWLYEELQRLMDFSTLDSCQLERGYLLGLREVSLEWKGSRKIRVNFQTMQGLVPEDNKCFQVQRKEKLTENGLPAFWQGMASDRKAKIIQLKQESLEYQSVEKRFNLSASHYQIQSIERIETIPLYEAYSLRKKQMEEKNGQEIKNERILYHGTSSEISSLICRHGFNRSFNQQSMFGHGVYFAVNAKYSTGKSYAKPNSDGICTLIQARVLTGNYTLGRSDLKAAPQRHASSGCDLFDSVVNNMDLPSVFVIFHDTQAYPEYRITFK